MPERKTAVCKSQSAFYFALKVRFPINLRILVELISVRIALKKHCHGCQNQYL
jgi:hypothetical protein